MNVMHLAYTRLQRMVLTIVNSPNICKDIQGVTGGTDQTSGECSLGQTIPI